MARRAQFPAPAVRDATRVPGVETELTAQPRP